MSNHKELWQAVVDTPTGDILQLDKLVVVYENKTYYYCKVYGTDKLKEISVASVENTTGSIRYSFNPDDLKRGYKVHKARLALQGLQRKLVDTRKAVGQLKLDIVQMEDDITGLLSQYPELKEGK